VRSFGTGLAREHGDPSKGDAMKSKTKLAALLVTASIAAAGVLTGCDEDDCPTNVGYQGPPPVPAGVYTVTGDRMVQVYWTPIRGADVETYGVYRSRTADGLYEPIAEVVASGDPYYVDAGLTNGTTYYYAVDADYGYGRSELSFETVADTPRPAGTGLVVYEYLADPLRSGIDLSRGAGGVGSDIVQEYDDPFADGYVILLDGLFRMVPTEVVLDGSVYENDIQDFGYTDDLDEINYAPVEGWSDDPVGVELILGHTYIVWTWDDHFAKFRVTEIGDDFVLLDWAYQVSEDEWERRQLAPRFAGASRAPGA
jgi:hypothetical protein